MTIPPPPIPGTRALPSSDPDAHSNAYVNGHAADSYAYADADADAHAYRPHVHADAHANLHGHAYSHADAHPHPDAHIDTQSYSAMDTNPDPYRYANAFLHADTHVRQSQRHLRCRHAGRGAGGWPASGPALLERHGLVHAGDHDHRPRRPLQLHRRPQPGH